MSKSPNEKFLELTIKKSPMEVIFFDNAFNGFLPKGYFFNDTAQYKFDAFCDKYIHDKDVNKIQNAYYNALSGIDTHFDVSLKKRNKYSLFVKSIQNNGAFLYFYENKTTYSMLDPFTCFAIDDEDKIIYASQKIQNILEFTNKNLCGKSIFEIVQNAQILKNEKITIKKKNGQVFYGIANIIDLNDMKIVYFDKIQDNTSLTFDNFLNDKNHVIYNIPIPYILIDSFGKIEWFNNAFAQNIAPDGEKIHGRIIGSWMKSNTFDNIPTLIENAEQTKTFKLYKGSIIYEMFLQDTIHQNIHDKIGNKLGDKQKKYFLFSMRDITDQENQQKKIINSQKLQTIGQVAINISHDFRNILTSIGMACEFLIKDCNTDMSKNQSASSIQRKKDLYTIKDGALKAEKLVNQILSFSKQQPVINLEHFSLNNQIKTSQMLLERLIGPKISLNIVENDNDARIYFDKSQFDQILVNLVVNARDAIQNVQHNGKIQIVIKEVTINNSRTEIRTDFIHHISNIPNGKYKAILIIDNGCGMTNTTIKQIFKPFFSTKGESGNGLGLATISEILSQNNAHIHVESQINKGSQFTVLFPIASSHAYSTLPHKKSHNQSTESSHTETTIIGQNNQNDSKQTTVNMTLHKNINHNLVMKHSHNNMNTHLDNNSDYTKHDSNKKIIYQKYKELLYKKINKNQSTNIDNTHNLDEDAQKNTITLDKNQSSLNNTLDVFSEHKSTANKYNKDYKTIDFNLTDEMNVQHESNSNKMHNLQLEQQKNNTHNIKAQANTNNVLELPITSSKQGYITPKTSTKKSISAIINNDIEDNINPKQSEKQNLDFIYTQKENKNNLEKSTPSQSMQTNTSHNIITKNTKKDISNLRVLVVDDNDSVRSFTSRVIQTITHHVADVESGEKALNLAHMQEFDILLSDIEMGEMDGKDLAEKIKKIQPNIKIIFLSGYNPDDLALGNKYKYKFLAKPFGLKEIVTTIESVYDDMIHNIE